MAIIPDAITECANQVNIKRREAAERQVGSPGTSVPAECLNLAEFKVWSSEPGKIKVSIEYLCRACASRFLRYGHSIIKLERMK